MKSNYSEWDKYHKKIRTKKGGWKIGVMVESHGYDLINELIGQYSYMQIVTLNATGKMPSKEFAYWLESVHISMSWPDPRIWCNRVSALAGTSKANSVASACAGIMTADSKNNGPSLIAEAVKFIQMAKLAIDDNIELNEFLLKEIKKNNSAELVGYSRPIATEGDNRIKALSRVANSLSFDIGDHLELAYRIENYLTRHHNQFMHLIGYIAAFMADQGFTSLETYHIFSILPYSGINACYVDSYGREGGTFSPLKISDIEYVGVKDRSLPN